MAVSTTMALTTPAPNPHIGSRRAAARASATAPEPSSRPIIACRAIASASRAMARSVHRANDTGYAASSGSPSRPRRRRQGRGRRAATGRVRSGTPADRCRHTEISGQRHRTSLSTAPDHDDVGRSGWVGRRRCPGGSGQVRAEAVHEQECPHRFPAPPPRPRPAASGCPAAA